MRNVDGDRNLPGQPRLRQSRPGPGQAVVGEPGIRYHCITMGDSHLAYQRSKFSTRLPTDRVFTEGHFWLAADEGGRHRIGFTRFATRMLGEVVEFDFEVQPGEAIRQGQAIGWFEGFKAVTELYSPLSGHFVAANPDLDQVIGEVHKFPYDRGWLYSVEGAAPDDCMDASGYARFLDGTIDRMMGKSG